MSTMSNTNVPFADLSSLASGAARGPACLLLVTRVTTGRTWQHFLDEETDGAHVGGRSNTGCTDSITFAKVRVAG